MAKNTQSTGNQEEKEKKNVTEEVVEESPEKEKQDTPAEEPAEEKTREQELDEKLAELQDKYLRLSAEFDNYRKRTLKEKAELLYSAKEEVLVNILPVIDDMERALGSIESAKDIKAVKEGLNLIYIKFKGYLKQEDVKEIEALNKEFDTDLHEAITKIPVEEKKKKGKVVDVVEKGYLLKDKVIRYAKVVIGE